MFASVAARLHLLWSGTTNSDRSTQQQEKVVLLKHTVAAPGANTQFQSMINLGTTSFALKHSGPVM